MHCCCTAEDAEDIHHDFAWDGAFQLRGKTIKAISVFFGIEIWKDLIDISNIEWHI